MNNTVAALIVRAKTIDNGKWICGHYLRTPLTSEVNDSIPNDGWFFLSGKERHCIVNNCCVFEIDVNTLCRYTNYAEENPATNSEFVCEFDVVNIQFTDEREDFKGIVEMIEGCWYARNKKECVKLWSEVNTVCVIGNIIDNPELLEAYNE